MAADQGARERQFRDVLYEALAGGDSSVRDADPVTVLERSVQRARSAGAGHPAALHELAPLETVALSPSLESAVAAATVRFADAPAFAEAIYFARCFLRDTAGTLALVQGRRYLNEAHVPAALPDLATDRAAVLDAASFSLLWREPQRREAMLNTLDIWRREYTGVYQAQHARYAADATAIAERMDAAAAAVRALERLNRLSRLGAPVAGAALARYHELERLYACQLGPAALAATLEESPLCPACGFRLGDEAPRAEAKRGAAAIDRGLASQLSRLPRRVVSRIIDRPGSDTDTTARFISVVQASDLAGLANILDDSLIEFLRRLLTGEEGDDADPMTILARRYPEVTSSNLDAAVEEFRRLLAERLAATGSVRLDGQGGPS